MGCSANDYPPEDTCCRYKSGTNASLENNSYHLLYLLYRNERTSSNNTTDVKVETIEMTIVTETATELNLENTAEVARLYKFKNARVTKALSFTTKRNKAKMA
jgi:hypothetical protein